MNKYNHFLTSFNLLFLLFIDSSSIIEIIIFSFIFGVLIDQSQRIGKYLKKPLHHRRTWIEEPFGFILIGIPIGLSLSLINKVYFFLVIIPYGMHVLLDYLTIHEVSPLAPFSRKNIKIGFFKSEPPEKWYTGKEKGISESYFLIFNITITIIILVMYFLLLLGNGHT